MLDLECNSKLLFVTGKGGTGKTLIASMCAVAHAQSGKKVLLIDAESTGTLAQQFEHAPVGYEPVEVTHNVFLMQCTTDAALSEYLKLYAKIPTWAKISPLARLVDVIAQAAPGVKEILIAGKIAYERKKAIEHRSDYDIIIVDSPSSGHVVSLIDAPGTLSRLITAGMLSSQTAWMRDILARDDTGVLIVTIPGDVVTSETRDLVEMLEQTIDTKIEGIVVNRDIIDLSDETGDDVKTTGVAEIDAIRAWYEDIITQEHDFVSENWGVPLWRFPLLFDELPALRTLMRNYEELRTIEVSP